MKDKYRDRTWEEQVVSLIRAAVALAGLLDEDTIREVIDVLKADAKDSERSDHDGDADCLSTIADAMHHMIQEKGE